MTEHKHKTIALGALLLAIGLAVAISAAGAVLTDGSVSSDQPDNQTVEVDLSFSGDGTTAQANLTSDGTVVQSDSVTGAGGESHTLTLPMTGLAEGDLNLDVSGTDESNVSVTDTRMLVEQAEVLDVSANDSMAVNVGFDAKQVTNATVTIESETGTTLRDETVSFDPIDANDGTGYRVVEWTPSSDYQNVTVSVEASPVFGYDSLYSVLETSGTAGGGFIGGAGRTEMIGFAVLLGIVLVGTQRGKI